MMPSTGAASSTTYGVPGALRRDEDDTVASTELYAQARVEVRRPLAAHGGRALEPRAASASRTTSSSRGIPTTAARSAYNATTPVRGCSSGRNERTTFYGNRGRGFETPTFAELANVNPPATGLNFGLEASRSRHLEAGVKAILPTACA